MSKKPNKSRKKFYELPKHKAVKAVSSHLNEKLKKELNKRAVSIRKGDTVKIVRGDHKGKEGKITLIDTVKKRVYVEKVVVKKSTGSEKQVPLQPSNLIVTDLERSDRKRFKQGSKKIGEEKK